jgi:hypothetical protein
LSFVVVVFFTQQEIDYKKGMNDKYNKLFNSIKEIMGGDDKATLEFFKNMNKKLFDIIPGQDNKQYIRVTFGKDFYEYKTKIIREIEKNIEIKRKEAETRLKDMAKFRSEHRGYNLESNSETAQEFKKMESDINTLYSAINNLEYSIKFLSGIQMRKAKNTIRGSTYNTTPAVMAILQGIINNNTNESELLMKDIYKVDAKEYQKLSPIEFNGWNTILTYLWMKNKRTAELIKKHYASDIEQIEKAVENMTREQKEVADILYNSVQDRNELNPYYVQVFNRDMGMQDNYFPRVSFHEQDTDLFSLNLTDDTREANISAIQARSFDAKPNLGVNPLQLAMKHIQQTEYIKHIAPKLKTTNAVFKSNEFKEEIVGRFGRGIYDSLNEHLKSFNLNVRGDHKTDLMKTVGIVTSRWISGVINSPSVFFKQITAGGYYMEGVSKTQMLANLLSSSIEVDGKKIKGRAAALEYFSDYLKTRYDDNNIKDFTKLLIQQNPFAISNNIQQFIDNNKFLNGIDKMTEKINLPELGDKVSVLWFGFARFKTQVDNGMSYEEAIKDFERVTIETQQETKIKSNISLSQKSSNTFEIKANRFKSQSYANLNKTLNTIIDEQANGEVGVVNMAWKIAWKNALTATLLSLVETGLKYWGDDDKERKKENYLMNFFSNLWLNALLEPYGLTVLKIVISNLINFDYSFGSAGKEGVFTAATALFKLPAKFIYKNVKKAFK